MVERALVDMTEKDDGDRARFRDTSSESASVLEPTTLLLRPKASSAGISSTFRLLEKSALFCGAALRDAGDSVTLSSLLFSPALVKVPIEASPGEGRRGVQALSLIRSRALGVGVMTKLYLTVEDGEGTGRCSVIADAILCV